MEDNLVLASPCENRLSFWKRGLESFASTTLKTDGLNHVGDNVLRMKPHILLLDFDLLGLNDLSGVATLKRLSRETKVIVLSCDISEDIEWELFKAGVRGCCRNDTKPEFLQQIIGAVQRGELWMRRTLSCRLIDELSKITARNITYRSSLSLIENLTQREYDIAMRVKNGESNKQVANACGITERTVKAHLTEIYIKLGVADRLNLALVLSADSRHERRGNGKQ